MGHARVYTICDILTRYYKLRNYQVFSPMGWDAFGLPAENAAIDRNLHPNDWTQKNITEMRKQMKQLGFQFNWEAELQTCQPQYYKHTQRIFLQMKKRGLAYQKEAYVNWDPVDKTVLANQQIDSEGRSWRSGVKVQTIKLKQWFLKITEYADDLVDGLKSLQKWPGAVKESQSGWIQKFELFVEDVLDLQQARQILISPKSDVYSGEIEGLFIKGRVYCVNPVTGKSDLQLKLSQDPSLDHVGGIMLRKKLKNLKQNKQASSYQVRNRIKQLYNSKIAQKSTNYKLKDWLISRQRYWGVPIPYLQCSKCRTQFNLFELQDTQLNQLLPIKLEQLQQFQRGTLYKQSMISYNAKQFQFIKCKHCGEQEQFLRDADTMDTFVDSSWYFLKYLDQAPSLNNSDVSNYSTDKSVFDLQKAKQWMPVDIYIGGIEHAIMHLLYARFVYKFLIDISQDKQAENPINKQQKQPFTQLITQGMVQAMTYEVEGVGFITQQQYEANYSLRQQSVKKYFTKMSKSKYNGINPLNVIQKHKSIDVLRLALTFSAPPDHVIQFQDKLMQSMKNWLVKINNLAVDITTTQSNYESDNRKNYLKFSNLLKDYHYHMKASRHFHVALAKLMEMRNILSEIHNNQQLTIDKQIILLNQLIRALYPFAPHFSSWIWSEINNNTDIRQQIWQESLQKQKQVVTKLSLQINGKHVSFLQFSDSKEEMTNNQIMQLIQKENPKFWSRVQKYSRIVSKKKFFNFII